MEDVDYLKFYNDECYLMDEVADRFNKTGVIEAADFYMLLVWKSNRAKNYHRDRLKAKAGTFEIAVSLIASSLSASIDRKDRMRILIKDWEFSLPTAPAILAILYPNEFTVYDIIVCKEVDHAYRPYLFFSDSLWEEYEEFQRKVEQAAPPRLSLRDKDRFLIGRSYRNDVIEACKA